MIINLCHITRNGKFISKFDPVVVGRRYFNKKLAIGCIYRLSYGLY